VENGELKCTAEIRPSGVENEGVNCKREIKAVENAAAVYQNSAE